MASSAKASGKDRLSSFAELLGTTAGAIHGRTQEWMDSGKLNEQLTRVRDAATQLIDELNQRRATSPETGGKKASRPSRPSRGENVDAPGKRHRKPMASDAGAKRTDVSVAKLRNARILRGSQPGNR